MAENIDLSLSLDTQAYVQGANAAVASTQQLAQAYVGLERQSTLLEKAMKTATPGRIVTAGFAGAVAAAAKWEQQLGSMQAVSKTTGQNMATLQKGMSELARQFPISNRGALEVVSTLQKIGLSGKDQTTVVRNLSKEFVNLGAATGQNAAMIGQQMVALNRAFGVADGNVAKFSKMGDTLTTVTAKIGGSASEIAAFGKQIAPMARSAGIGETAVLGISAAFSKMGEDGYAASNAMNRVLSDMNRSIRDGSGEMGTYANIVGKTREEFEALYKANPNQALSQVLNQLGGGGPGSERNLERIGLDGPRTARVLQGLSQQGGIESAVATALGTDPGTTAAAGQAAMDGLIDEFERLGAASEQVAEAFGRPLLDAVTKITQITGAPMKAGAAVVGNDTVQALIGRVVPIAAAAATVWLTARAAGGLGMTSAVIRNIGFNNGIVRGAMEGFRAGTNGREVVGPVTNAMNQGRLDNMGFYGAAATRAVNTGRGFGESWQYMAALRANDRFDRLVNRGMSPREAQGIVTTPGPSIAERARNIGGAIIDPRRWGPALEGIAQIQGTINNLTNESARNLRAQNDPTYRRLTSVFRISRDNDLPPGYAGPVGPANRTVGGLQQNLRNIYGNFRPPEMGTTDRESGGMRARASEFGASATAFLKAMPQMSAVVAQTGGDVLKGSKTLQSAGHIATNSLLQTARGVRALNDTTRAMGINNAIGGVARMVASPMAALALGTAVVSNISGNKQADAERTDELLASSITGTIDAYRDSMGQASDSTATFAEQIQAATKALMRNVSTVDQATAVTEQDIQYARQTKKDVVNDYGNADDKSVAEQIRAALGGERDPQVLQGIKVDLLRQGRSATQAEDILDSATNGNATDFNQLFAGVAEGNGLSGMDKFRRALLGQQGIEQNSWQSAAGIAAGGGLVQIGSMFTDWAGMTDRRAGSGSNAAKISDEQQVALSSALEAMSQEERRNSSQYGADYARQQELRTAEAIYQGALKTNNADLIAVTSKDLSALVGGKDDARSISAKQYEESGGFIQALRDLDKSFAEQTRGVDLNPNNKTPGLTPKLTDDAITRATDNIELFGRALSNRVGDVDSSINKITQTFLKAPQDMEKFRAAVNGMVSEGEKAGMSLTQVGNAALSTVKALGDATSDVSRLAMAVFEKTSQRIERDASTVGTGVTLQRRLEASQNLMNSADSTPEGQARYDRGSEEQYQALEAAKNVMKQRLQAERQYQISSSRARFDFNQQREYAERDYQKGLLRAEEDYQTSRSRALRDFNIQMEQGQEDFNTSRMRAQRDFNKQMRRMNEDAAKSMYDPYKRMQVQATSDVGTLMVNLREQNEAMQRQAANLDRLRQLGVNNNTIDQLGLGKADNAQQASRIVADLESGGDVTALNNLIVARMSAAATLNMDESNKDVQRSREDFNQNLIDQEKDFNKSVARSRKAFNQSMADMARDYQKGLARNEKDFRESLARQNRAFQLSLVRQREDIEESQKEILGTYDQLQSAVFDVMQGKAVDFSKLMKSTLDGVVTATHNAAAQVGGLTGLTAPAGAAPSLGGHNPGNPVVGQAGGTRSYSASAIGRGNTTSLIDDVAGDSHANVKVTSVKRNKGDNSYHNKWQAVDYAGEPKEMLKLAKYLRGQVQKGAVKLSELIHWSPVDGQKYFVKDNQLRDVYNGATWNAHRNHVHVAMNPDYAKKMLADYAKATSTEKTARMDGTGTKDQEFAKGGIVTGRTQAIIGEAGYAEAVIPLNTSGVGVLARAMTQYMAGPDLQRMMTAGRGDRVVYNGGQTFIEDHSIEVTGPITVQSEDPNAMMRALQAKARAANLTSAPQRKGGR